MFFSNEITVPKNTAITAPVETVIPVTRGIIDKVGYRPRPGHAGLCHCRVYYHEHQIYPVSRDQDLHGDTFPIEWNDQEEIFTAPYTLVVRSWNDDDTYEHAFDISFSILDEQKTIGSVLSRAIIDLFSFLTPRRIFGGV